MKKMLFCCLGLFLAHTLAGPLEVEVTLMSSLKLGSISISADEMERYRSPEFANRDEAFRQDICERIPEVIRLSTYEKPVPHILCMRLMQDFEPATMPERHVEKYHATLIIDDEANFDCPNITQCPEIMFNPELIADPRKSVLDTLGGFLIGYEDHTYCEFIKVKGIGVVQFLEGVWEDAPLTLEKLFDGQFLVGDVAYNLKDGLNTCLIDEFNFDLFDLLRSHKRPVFTRGFADFLVKAKRPILEILGRDQIEPDRVSNIFVAMCMLYTGEDIEGIEERKKRRDISLEEIEEGREILGRLNLIPYR